MVFIFLLVGCNKNKTNDENVQKLLDRQAEMQEKQEKSVDQLEHLKDSLATEKQSLLNQRKSKDLQIKTMEKNQQILTDKLKEEQITDVSAQRSELNAKIITYEDSINQLKQELMLLNKQLDSVENSIVLYEIQEDESEKIFESGIVEIDQIMTQRENQKRKEIKRVGLLKKRALIADKKIEAYELERQLYMDELENQKRNNASEENLAKFQKRIVEMDSIINGETNNKKTIEQEISQAETYISESDAAMNKLQAQINSEYTKKEIIEDFIAQEKERFRKELEQIRSTRRVLLQEQTDLTQNLARVESQIAQLNKNVELIKSKKMSDILEQQAANEQEEASLAGKEITMLEQDSRGEMMVLPQSSDSVNEELVTLLKMGNQIDSLNKLIKAEKAEIAKTRKELSEKRASSAAKRAKIGRVTGSIIIIVILGGIALLAFFYYLGKRSRKS
jgi:chromosome segregation ATPase